MQHVTCDEVAITDAAIVGRNDCAGLRAQLICRRAETLCRNADQDFAGLRRRIADRRAGILHRIAAGGETLICSARRIGRDETNYVRIDLELLCGDLDERGLDALTNLTFAGEDSNRAVRIDTNPGIEHRRLFQAAGQRRLRSGVLLFLR